MSLSIECRPDYILVTGNGLSSLREAQRHFQDLSTLLARQRLDGRGARILVDLREGAPQTQEISTHIEKVSTIIYREGDRIAILVGSTILKLQIQRIHARVGSRMFLTKEAAEEFLCRADAPDPPAGDGTADAGRSPSGSLTR